MIKIAKRLVKKYESLTLEIIESAFVKSEDSKFIGGNILQDLTGFGTTGSCMLCIACHTQCQNCIHSFNPNWKDRIDFPCLTDTYDNICFAESSEQLLEAIKDRIINK